MSSAAPAAARPKAAARAEPGAARAVEPPAPGGVHALALALHSGGVRAPAAPSPPAPPPPSAKMLRRRCAGPCDEELTLRRACARCSAAEQTERRTGVPQPRCPDCEAERAAAAGAPPLHRSAAAEGGAGEARMDGGGSAGEAVRPVIGARGGRPLDPATRAFFEAGFGHDLRGVRVHTGPAADASARAVNARAYAVGRDVVFRAGEYAPASGEGKRLLAHELAHVAQHASAGGTPRLDRAPVVVGSVDDPAEREADAAAEAALSGRRTSVAAAAPALRRVPETGRRSGGGAAERPLTREEEIEQSQHARGQVTGESDPLTITLYAYTIGDPHPRPRHRAALHVLLRALQRLPSGTATVEVVGHADASGEPPFNDPLSEARAAEVAAALAGSGVPVTQRGEGESAPAAGNGTVRGRARNRRVDIVIHLTPIRRPEPGPVPPDREPDPPPREPEPHRDPPPEQDDRGFCARHPVICFLAALGALVGLGAAALSMLTRLGSLLAALAALGALGATLAGLLAGLAELAIAAGVGGAVLGLVAGLAELLRRLLRRPPGLPPGGDPPDGDPPEEPEDPEVSVTFSPVRHDNTPIPMSDRVPPGPRTTLVVATVTGMRAGMEPVVIRPAGGPGSGTVTLNGGAEVRVTGTATLRVQGGTSSDGSAPPLVLVARRGGGVAGRSAPFRVAAIPVNMQQRYESELLLGRAGITVRVDMDSDSGDPADLNEVTMYEVIERVSVDNGCFSGYNISPPRPVPASAPAEDTIGAPVAIMQSDGYIEVMQVHVFQDARTGTNRAAIERSGYRMSLEVENTQWPRPLILTVTKWGWGGSAADASGTFFSDAGRTTPPRRIRHRVDVPRQGPPPLPPAVRRPPAAPGGAAPPVPAAPGTGGGGARAAGDVHPRPWDGPVGTRAGSLVYVSGLTDPPPLGVHTLTVALRSGGRMYLADTEFEVMSVTGTEVVTRSANTRPLNLAPEGDPPLILGVHTPGRLSRELIRQRQSREPEVDAALPPGSVGPVHTPPPDAGLPGGTGTP